jgi:hypothetical protein
MKLFTCEHCGQTLYFDKASTLSSGVSPVSPVGQVSERPHRRPNAHQATVVIAEGALLVIDHQP